MPETPETYLFNLVVVEAEDPENPGTYINAPFDYHVIIGVLNDDPPKWPPEDVDPIHKNVVLSGGLGGMWEVPANQNVMEICFGKKVETTPDDPWQEYGGGVTVVPYGEPWHVRFMMTFPLKPS